MGDVHALGTQLAGHALGQGAEPELADRQVGEHRAAAQGRRRSGEDDGAGPARRHGPGRRPADEEPAQAADPPAAFEVRRLDLKDARADKGAGVVDDERRFAELRRDPREQVRDAGLIGGVAGESLGVAARGPNVFDHVLEPPRIPCRHGDVHAGPGETPDQRRAEPGAGANHNGHFPIVHFPSLRADRLCA